MKLDNINFDQWSDSVELVKPGIKLGGCKHGLSVFDKNSDLKCSTECKKFSTAGADERKHLRSINDEFKQSVEALSGFKMKYQLSTTLSFLSQKFFNP